MCTTVGVSKGTVWLAGEAYSRVPAICSSARPISVPVAALTHPGAEIAHSVEPRINPKTLEILDWRRRVWIRRITIQSEGDSLASALVARNLHHGNKPTGLGNGENSGLPDHFAPTRSAIPHT